MPRKRKGFLTNNAHFVDKKDIVKKERKKLNNFGETLEKGEFQEMKKARGALRWTGGLSELQVHSELFRLE